jgi:hypothetical protein
MAGARWVESILRLENNDGRQDGWTSADAGGLDDLP